MLNNFKKIVNEASQNNYAVIGFNIFGYEDAISVINAAQKGNFPVILMVNKLATNFMNVKYWGPLLSELAKDATVPVGVHLDHCSNKETIFSAITYGFTSVMYDGSQLPLEENITLSKEIVKAAQDYDVAVEGEVGYVAYLESSKKLKNIYTDPAEAKIYAAESGVDWVAVSIGNVHRMQTQESVLDYGLLEEIETKVSLPLVIHGASGISNEDLTRLSRHRVGKINIGTALRTAFTSTLRAELAMNPTEFDKINLFQKPMQNVEIEVMNKAKLVGLC